MVNEKQTVEASGRSLKELLRESNRVKEGLGIDAKYGYDIPEQHFQEAYKRRSARKDCR